MASKFIIIGRSTCKFCVMAQDFLIASQKQFQFLDYSSHLEILEEYKEFYKQKTVPIILASDIDSGITHKVGGYTDLLDFEK